jgi:anti-anti-sigma factor
MTPEPGLETSVTRDDARTVLHVSGEIDLGNARALGDQVREHLADAPVFLDLRGVSFMDSSGVRMLDTLAGQAQEAGWTLRVGTELSDQVRRVLEMTGMMGALPMEEGP